MRRPLSPASCILTVMERRGQCTVLVLMLLVARFDGFELDLDDGVAVLKLGRELITEIFYTWNALAPDPKEKEKGSGVELPFLKGKERRILERLTEVSRKIDRMREKQIISATTAAMLLRDLPQAIRLENHIQKLADIQSRINIADMQLNRYIRHGYINETESWTLERHTLENLVTWVVSHEPTSIRGLMEEMHNMVAPQGSAKRGLLHLLMESMKNATSLCSCSEGKGWILWRA